MKRLIGVVLLWAGAAWAGIPELESGVYLQNGNAPLTVDYFTAPSVLDWNNDGKKDLLVGQFTGGYIWLFRNVGSDAQPVLSGGQQLRVGSDVLSTSYG